jgi:hypothetical protein
MKEGAFKSNQKPYINSKAAVEVLMTMIMESVIFLVMTPFSLVQVRLIFG